MNINSNFSSYTQNYTNKTGQDAPIPPEILAQLAAQNQTQKQAADYGLQGPGQDAMLSISDSSSAVGASRWSSRSAAAIWQARYPRCSNCRPDVLRAVRTRPRPIRSIVSKRL